MSRIHTGSCRSQSSSRSSSCRPVTLLNGDYDRVWEATKEAVAAICAGREGGELGGTAESIYRFDETVDNTRGV